MRFAALGSGSRGNAYLVEEGGTCLMIDCGFSMRETERRLGRLGKSPSDLAGMLVTHEHSDHICGVESFARRHNVPVWMTAGTHRAGPCRSWVQARLIGYHEALEIRDIQVQPFAVPHDAHEPSQFVFSNGALRLAIVTDLGSHTPHVLEHLTGCDALVLECNHEEDLLANGSYPPMLKRRVGGSHGHLSNRQAAILLEGLDASGLQHLVAAHLSEKHNTPGLARQALSAVLGCHEEWIGLAHQDRGLGWRDMR